MIENWKNIISIYKNTFYELVRRAQATQKYHGYGTWLSTFQRKDIKAMLNIIVIHKKIKSKSQNCSHTKYIL